MVLNIGLKCWAILGVPIQRVGACIQQWMAMEWSTSSWIRKPARPGECLVFQTMVIWYTTLDHTVVLRVVQSLTWGPITLANRISLQI